MTETTPAFLLRTIKLTDTSLIVTWFTQAHGKLKTVAKGARRPKSPFAGKLDLFFGCEITFLRSMKSELHILKEVVLRDPFEGLRENYRRTQLAAYFVELIELVTEPEHPVPELYGEHPKGENGGGNRVRTGVSEVIDGGQDVIVLFSVVNPQARSILLMPPQVQLGGKTKQGKLIKQSRWTTAEQLPVMDYRLSKRRLAPGERADGVVVFERPPFKQSNETLFLQMAEAGAVDHPALAPIGFGISTTEENNHGRRGTGQ